MNYESAWNRSTISIVIWFSCISEINKNGAEANAIDTLDTLDISEAGRVARIASRSRQEPNCTVLAISSRTFTDVSLFLTGVMCWTPSSGRVSRTDRSQLFRVTFKNSYIVN